LIRIPEGKWLDLVPKNNKVISTLTGSPTGSYTNMSSDDLAQYLRDTGLSKFLTELKPVFLHLRALIEIVNLRSTNTKGLRNGSWEKLN
jgi:hypothetical protein